MSALTVFVIIISSAVVFVFAACVAILRMNPRRVDPRSRQRILELEDTLDSLLSLAYEHRIIDPHLADIIIDEIKTAKKRNRNNRRELG